MKVFVAGASGAIGKPLLSQLAAAGYQVVAMTRSAQNAERLGAQGAETVMADALDRAAVLRAMRETQPEIVIHELTSLTGLKGFKHFDRDFALTNRLRTEGTDNLLAAARAAGAQRFIAQSYGGWTYASANPTVETVKSEEDPFDPTPPANQAQSLRAIQRLEDAVLGAEGIEGVVLRYSNFYGPGTGVTHADSAALVRKRMFPVIGDGAGVWSFLHVEDAAAATVAAIAHGAPGVYNVADDDPAPVRVWLPAYAQMLGARPPLRVPVWLGRLLAGDVTVAMMTRVSGLANAKAKRELAWAPRYASWRDGFKAALS